MNYLKFRGSNLLKSNYSGTDYLDEIISYYKEFGKLTQFDFNWMVNEICRLREECERLKRTQ